MTFHQQPQLLKKDPPLSSLNSQNISQTSAKSAQHTSKMQFILALSAFAATVAAAPHQIEERGGTGTGILLNTIINIIKGQAADYAPFNPCPNWPHTPDNDYYTIMGKSSDGTSMASICYTNNTATDDDSNPINIVFGDDDASVACCLSTLHSTQSDSCISVSGSSCDYNDYSANGAILNMRLPGFGSGTSSGWQIDQAKNEAAQSTFHTLVGNSIILQGAMPMGYWWSVDSDGNPQDSTGSFELNLNGGSTNWC